MKPQILFRGAVLSGAVSLARAGVAAADRASRGRTVHASATTTSPLPALNYGQNTPLHLSGSGISHAASDASATGSIVRTIVGLAIVIAVIYGLSWIVRQARKAKNPALGTGLEQIASLPLGTGRSVSLVRVGSELHLLGIAEHGVSRIRTFTEDEAIAAGLPIATRDEYEDNPPPISKAIDLLRRMTVR
jgi:flagellar protein FliO/FliZ